MRVRPTTKADIRFVMAHVDGRHREEFQAIGLTHYEVLLRTFDWQERYGSETLVLDSKPACILGFIPDGDGWLTWFIATEDFYLAGSKALRLGRRYMAGRENVRTISYSQREDAEKWFRLFGFEKVEKIGMATVYRLRSTSPTPPAI